MVSCGSANPYLDWVEAISNRHTRLASPAAPSVASAASVFVRGESRAAPLMDIDGDGMARLATN